MSTRVQTILAIQYMVYKYIATWNGKISYKKEGRIKDNKNERIIKLQFLNRENTAALELYEAHVRGNVNY